jgi:hypothetical protein
MANRREDENTRWIATSKVGQISPEMGVVIDRYKILAANVGLLKWESMNIMTAINDYFLARKQDKEPCQDPRLDDAIREMRECLDRIEEAASAKV